MAGDVSAAERDRYLFLETILAARERIFFSYVARNAKTGDELEPSPVIRELQSILRGFVDEKMLAKLTLKHPISRYDLKYFSEFSEGRSSDCEPEFASFDPDARRGARMLALRNKIGATAPDRTRREGDSLLDGLGAKFRERVEEDLQFATFGSTPAATNMAPTEIALPIAAIRRYLECPLQGAARYSLGMLEDEDAPEDAEDEPIEQSRLNRAVMLRKVFWRAGGNLDVIDEEYAREVRIAQAHGHASAGQFAEAAKVADDSALRQWIAQASEAGVSDFDGWKDIRIGRADEFADAGEILASISLDAEVRRHDGTTSNASGEPLRHDSRRFGGSGRRDQLRAAQDDQTERFSSGVSERDCTCRDRSETARQISRDRDSGKLRKERGLDSRVQALATKIPRSHT